MKQSNKDKLEKYRRIYTLWSTNQELVDVDGAAKNEILEVIRAEFDPNYSTDLWCGVCVAKMVTYAFEEMDKQYTTINIKI